MHRGFTIDTWDYVSDDQQRFGGSVFMVYLACIIREEPAEGILGDMRSPKALLAA
jgi:hypothetical protein